MSDDVASAPLARSYTGVVAAAAGALLAGVLVGVAGMGVFVAVLAVVALVAVMRFPREGALATGLAAPLNNLVVVHTSVLDMRFTEVLWVAILASVVWRAATRQPVPFQAPPRWLTAVLAALVGWQALSAVVNGLSARAVVEVTQTAYFAVILWVLAGTFGTLDPATRDRILRAAGVVAVVLLVFSIAYFALHLDWPFIAEVSARDGVVFEPPGMTVQEAKTGVTLTRLSAFDQSTVTTASLVTGLLGAALAAGLAAPRPSDRRWGWALFWVSAVVLLLTFSRAGWLLAGVVVLLVAWRVGVRQLIATVCSFLVIAALLLLVPQVRGRIAEFNDPNETSTAIHLQMWGRAISFANESPVLGGGPYSFVERTRVDVDEPAHNFVLEAAADTGWTGAGITLGLVLSLLAFGWRRLRAGPALPFSLWVGLLAAMLMNLTMNGFREEVWWVWAGLMVAVAAPPAVAAQKPDASPGHRMSRVA